MTRVKEIPKVRVETDVIVLDGGLDLVTPRISLKPGRVIGGENWEVAWNHGYTRVAGYERFDGRSPKPSAASPSYVTVGTLITVPAVGATVQGQSSGVTATVAGFAGTTIILFNASGEFTIPETLLDLTTSPGTTVGTTTAVPSLTTEAQAMHRAAVANQARTLISPPGGSGPCRGIFHLVIGGVDQFYTFRDNVPATGKNLYRATSSGWVAVPFGYYLEFTAGGPGIPQDGDQLAQGGSPPTATATVKRVVLESGAWNGSPADAAGRLIIQTVDGSPPGTFTAGAATVGGIPVTLGGAETAITLPPGGTFQFFKNNFSGLALDQRIYGADGVGLGIEFDGTDEVLVPIRTGTVPDTPSCVTVYHNYLFWAIRGSVIHSGPGLPYAYTAADGGGEIAGGDTITNFSIYPASQAASALAIYCENSTQFLFGRSPTDWSRDPYKTGVGAYPFTSQTLDHGYVFHHTGLIDFRAAESFGNFVQSGLTVNLQPLVSQLRSSVSCSTVERSKSQYRLWFTDGSGLFITIVNGQWRGTFPVRYAHVPVVAHESVLADGNPVSLFGDDTGMVYELERGTSFDGEPIAATGFLSWYYGKNARMIKHWVRALVEVEATSLVQFQLGYNLRYSDLDSVPAGLEIAVEHGATSIPQWDNFVWDNFVWDGTPPVPTIQKLRGSSVNVQFALTSISDYLQPFRLSAIVLNYTNRRLER